MKSFFIVVIILLVLSPMNAVAEEFTYSSSDTQFSPNADDYIPDNVRDELENSGLSPDSDNLIKTLFSFVLNLVKSSLSELLPSISGVFATVLISSLFFKIIDNQSYLKIISFVSTAFISYNVYNIFMKVSERVGEALSELGELLSSVIPSFCTVLLLGGGSFSAMSSSASLGCILTTLKLILSELLAPTVGIMFTVITLEKLSPSFSEIRLSASIKKYFMLILSFVTTIMLTVISFQSILASSKDSISGRALKFTASSFIPVVGGAVSESLKTVGAGVKYLKNTVGISVALAVFSVIIPTVCMLFSLKLLLGLVSLSSGLCGASKEKELIDSFVGIIDILLGIIICTTILSILVVVLFVTTAFSVGVA